MLLKSILWCHIGYPVLYASRAKNATIFHVPCFGRRPVAPDVPTRLERYTTLQVFIVPCSLSPVKRILCRLSPPEAPLLCVDNPQVGFSCTPPHICQVPVSGTRVPLLVVLRLLLTLIANRRKVKLEVRSHATVSLVKILRHSSDIKTRGSTETLPGKGYGPSRGWLLIVVDK